MIGWNPEKKTEPIELVYAAGSNELKSACMRTIHQFSGHPVIKRTLYLVRMVSPGVPNATVREVVWNCKCQSIDPASVYRKMSRLDVHNNWNRVGMGMTHFGAWHYLMLTDWYPSQFNISRPLLQQNSASIIRLLETVFYERGPLVELLTVNSTIFCGEMFTKISEVWSLRMRFRCANIPSSN